MAVYRAVVLGRAVEITTAWFARRRITVDGQPVRLTGGSHLIVGMSRFEMTDQLGKPRLIEMWLRCPDRTFSFRQEAAFMVDGVECVVVGVDNECSGCGYTLRGLDARHGEVRCPECGRIAVVQGT